MRTRGWARRGCVIVPAAGPGGVFGVNGEDYWNKYRDGAAGSRCCKSGRAAMAHMCNGQQAVSERLKGGDRSQQLGAVLKKQ